MQDLQNSTFAPNRLGLRLKADERRAQIVAEAAKLCTESGVDSMTIAKVAGRLGITRNLAYHYFPNKTALLSAVVAAETAKLIDSLTELSGTTPRERLVEMLGIFFDYLQKNPIIGRLVDTPEGMRLVSETGSPQRPLLARRFAEALGCPRTPIYQSMVEASVDFTRNFLYSAIAQPDAFPKRDEAANFIAELVLEGIGRVRPLAELVDARRLAAKDAAGPAPDVETLITQEKSAIGRNRFSKGR